MGPTGDATLLRKSTLSPPQKDAQFYQLVNMSIIHTNKSKTPAA